MNAVVVALRPETNDQALALVSSAQALLEQATTIDEIRGAHEFAATARMFLRGRADAHEAFIVAAAFELRAVRRLGAWLAKQPKARGGRPSSVETSDTMSPVSVRLRDLGVSKQESSRWQTLAAVPESMAEAYFAVCMKNGKPPTAAGLRQLLRPATRPRSATKSEPPTAAQAHRAAWEALSDDERAAFLAELSMVPVVTLESLANQRKADPEFAKLRDAQRAIALAMPSRAQRMLDFTLEGGELALLRLGLSWDVTHDTLKAAHKAAVLRTHPDHGGLPSEFIAITNANNQIKAFLGDDGRT